MEKQVEKIILFMNENQIFLRFVIHTSGMISRCRKEFFCAGKYPLNVDTLEYGWLFSDLDIL